MKKRKNNRILVAGVIVLGLIIFAIYFVSAFKQSQTSQQLFSENDLKARFELLKNAKTNFCAGPAFIDYKKDEDRLQGSCCSQMDFHRYAEQIEGLKKYSFIGLIPSDPYDVPVSTAKQMLEYQKTIQLSADQQKAYDEAVKMSEEGGPCCCKCWRWYAYEGLAKYLITKYDFSSRQIAEIWDLSDGCGGAGHIEGMHT